MDIPTRFPQACHHITVLLAHIPGIHLASLPSAVSYPGCIQVSEITRNLLSLRHTFEDRGGVEVKGKVRL